MAEEIVKQYRKKPVVIKALLFDGTAQSASNVISWVLAKGGVAHYRCNSAEECNKGAEGHRLIIKTLEGDHVASPGDFIIRGVLGEFYPCKPDIFAQTYEEA